MQPSTFEISWRGCDQLFRSRRDGQMMAYSILLGGGDLLDSKSVVKQAVAGEVYANVLLHELNREIKVVDTLDPVADTAEYEITHTHHQDQFK
jgi:hypothetical protein